MWETEKYEEGNGEKKASNSWDFWPGAVRDPAREGGNEEYWQGEGHVDQTYGKLREMAASTRLQRCEIEECVEIERQCRHEGRSAGASRGRRRRGEGGRRPRLDLHYQDRGRCWRAAGHRDQ